MTHNLCDAHKLHGYRPSFILLPQGCLDTQVTKCSMVATNIFSITVILPLHTKVSVSSHTYTHTHTHTHTVEIAM